MENDGTVIEVKEVSFVFQDKPVLEEVTMTVKTGAFLAIIGPNGAGKSTLLRIILGLLQPTKGSVRVFGKSTQELGEYRHRIAYVPQMLSADLRFPIRVEDVVLMGRYGRIGFGKGPAKKDRDICREMMVKVGIDSLRGRPLSRLSGGQLQRVLLARALANEPELLILDEPTSGVDQSTTFNLYEMLKELHKEGITILLVSHDIGVVANFVDGIACLNRKLIVHGKPSEVLTSTGLEQMYGCEAVFLHHCKIPQLVVEER
jgi:zinc transport system ATP-binding protein